MRLLADAHGREFLLDAKQVTAIVPIAPPPGDGPLCVLYAVGCPSSGFIMSGTLQEVRQALATAPEL